MPRASLYYDTTLPSHIFLFTFATMPRYLNYHTTLLIPILPYSFTYIYTPLNLYLPLPISNLPIQANPLMSFKASKYPKSHSLPYDHYTVKQLMKEFRTALVLYKEKGTRGCDSPNAFYDEQHTNSNLPIRCIELL